MANELQVMALQEGSKLLGSLFKAWILKPTTTSTPASQALAKEETAAAESTITVEKPEESATPPVTGTPHAMFSPEMVKLFNPSKNDDADYRWECCLKHLGAAAVLLREAHERAVTDKAVTEGVAEKVMAALSEHAGMDDDLKPMLTNKETKPAAEKLADGLRQLRRAAWDVGLPTGKGTVEDVADARLWNDYLFQDAYSHAKKTPGRECVASGM